MRRFGCEACLTSDARRPETRVQSVSCLIDAEYRHAYLRGTREEGRPSHWQDGLRWDWNDCRASERGPAAADAEMVAFALLNYRVTQRTRANLNSLRRWSC